jgi:2-phosphoglycerate kinase
MRKIYFITGVNGVGKTTVIEHLKSQLGSGFEVHDFDERGVPNNVGRQWRIDETKYWIELGLANYDKRIKTVVCGFARPSEQDNPEVGFILLDADQNTIKKRLWNRYQTPESIETIERVSGKTVDQFIQDNINFSETIRDEAKEYGIRIINTTPLNPEEVAKTVIDELLGGEIATWQGFMPGAKL